MIETAAEQATAAPLAGTPGQVLPPLPFTPEEETAFHKEDRQAAGMVVGLMATIFSLGLLGYVTICLIAAGG